MVEIVDAMNDVGDGGLWDETDGFYYDQLLIEGRHCVPLRVRSLVGLLPLFAVEILDEDVIEQSARLFQAAEMVPEKPLRSRAEISYRKTHTADGASVRRLLAIPTRERLERVLQVSAR